MTHNRSHTAMGRVLIGAALATTVIGLGLVGQPLAAQGTGAACKQAKAQKKSGPFGARFGKLAGAAALAAVTGRKAAANAAADAAVRDTVDASAEQAQSEAAIAVACAGEGEGEAAQQSSVSLKPAAAKASYRMPTDMPVAPEIKAQIAAFDEFGKVRCGDCEGGYAFDSWAQQAFTGELRGEHNGWARKLGAMEPGEALHWKGAQHAGTITMTAAGDEAGFACKRYTYVLERGAASATRPGLVCWGKLNAYAGSDSWVEVY